MSTPKYKYSREYVIKKIKTHHLLYSFLKEKKYIINLFLHVSMQMTLGIILIEIVFIQCHLCLLIGKLQNF